MRKPELLVPAGNAESFYAAIDAGANAVYLGLKQFNARNRAQNFSIPQLLGLIDIAKKNNLRVYITLNTVIKNKELPDLLDTLHLLSKLEISAVIIQDWGVYYAVKKFFPTLEVHASTQMALHNSVGANYAQHKNFERVILARELMYKELELISKNSNIELEVFSHGALCYSFSGMCLFSSYMGGKSANRGMCKQPCRRMYHKNTDGDFIFSLKDNQLIEFIPDLMRMGIASIKIEGRLKPGDYVNYVASAYRKVIDKELTPEQGKSLLESDMGREKTSYFFGGSIKNAITQYPASGLFLGKIHEIKSNSILLNSTADIEERNRIRVVPASGGEHISVRVQSAERKNNGQIEVFIPVKGMSKNDDVFLAGKGAINFSSKLPEKKANFQIKQPKNQQMAMLKSLKSMQHSGKQQLFFRVDSIKWLMNVHFDSADGAILNFTKKEWENFNFKTSLMRRNARKIIVELPKFIPETNIDFYKKIVNSATKSGVNQFMISHLSQKLLLPKQANFYTNENVYAFNDLAIKTYFDEGARNFVYPLENEFDNLVRHKYRNGFVPLFYYPHLFYSRMPVKVESSEIFEDEKGYRFIKQVRDGITYVLPHEPVGLFQFKKKLMDKGFKNFLIDLSFEKPINGKFNNIMKHLRTGTTMNPTGTFNFKKGFS